MTHDPLDIAEQLIRAGIPVRHVRPDIDPDTREWRPKGGSCGNGYWLPTGWPDSRPSMANIDRFSEGEALIAIMGYGLDLIDVDPRNGGDESLAAMQAEGLIPPEIFARATTPSGGQHLFVRSTGHGNWDGIRPGIDIKAGDGTGKDGGHGIAWIAPTVRISKTTGEPVRYEWVEFDLSGLADTKPHAPLVEAMAARPKRERGTWAQPDGEDHPEFEAAAREYVAHLTEGFDADGSGWNGRVYGLSRDLARVVHGRCGLGAEELGEALLGAAGPWDASETDTVERIWERALDSTASEAWRPAFADLTDLTDPNAPEPTRVIPAGQQARPKRPGHELGRNAQEFDWLRQQIGKPGGPLEDWFRSGQSLTHPELGPRGQNHLWSTLQERYIVHRWQKDEETKKQVLVPATYPASVVKQAFGGIASLPNVRELRGVTSVPFLRADGSVCDQPGYDDATGVWMRDVEALPQVDRPRALQMLGDMLGDFPWVTTDDKAAYLAALFAPVVRGIAPPPWPMWAVAAHQRGSGKGYLASVLRTLFDGSLATLSPDPEEARKAIASQLDAPAGVTVFDNFRGVLQGAALEALLTADTYTDRVLGKTLARTWPNDRLWVATGNNVQVGQDMGRRVVAVHLDAKMSRPETRRGFKIDPFVPWVVEHRQELLAALLRLAVDWVHAGRPAPAASTTDTFGAGLAVLGGIVAHTGLAPGGRVAVIGTATSPGDEEWALMLSWIDGAYPGGAPFRVRDLVLAELDSNSVVTRTMPGDLLPTDVVKLPYDARPKVLGRWLANRVGQWAGGMAIEKVGVRNGYRQYRVIHEA